MQRDVRGILSKLPKTLDETYERVLRDIHEDNREHARRLLHCLAVAVRPLRVEELAEILTFDFDAAEEGIPEYHADWRWKDEGDAVLSTCSSLITIAEYYGKDDDDRYYRTRVVQFSHFSVKEFLMSNRLATPTRDVSRYHILPGPAHTILAQACLGLLLQLDGHIDIFTAKGFPLAKYAAKNWVAHAQFQDVASHVKYGIRDLFDADKPHLALWLGIHDIDHEPLGEFDERIWPETQPTSLYYSALCGFHDTALDLAIKYPQHVNAIGGRYDSPLASALSQSHVRVAEVLLEHGGDLDVHGTRGRTPLHTLLLRIDHDNKDSLLAGVRLLLRRGADVNARDEDDQTPLYMLLQPQYLAQSRNHCRDDYTPIIVQLLQEHGADMNTRDRDYNTPLLLAVSRGLSDIARLLLEHGADPNTIYEGGQTLLHLLSGPFLSGWGLVWRDDHLAFAQLLLEHGADVNARDNAHKTPLLLAVRRKALNIANVLLEHGADPNTENSEGNTPLHTLFLERDNDNDNDVLILQLLLKHGADMGARNKNHATSLDLAPYSGKILIAEVLLDHANGLEGKYSQQHCCSVTHCLNDRNVGANAQDKDHGAQLRLACYCGRLNVVQELLNYGANTKLENFQGENPLHLLSQGEYDSHDDGVCIAQELLARGVDVNAQSKCHRTPLHLASDLGKFAIARVLLEHGAKPNVNDDHGETPLHLLARGKYYPQNDGISVTRLLIEWGADVYARDMNLRTPLHHASYNGMLAIAQVLLEHDGIPNVVDRNGETPLHLASQGKDDFEERGIGITRLLLEHGADVDAQNNYHETPLDLSTRLRKPKIVSILREHSANVFCAWVV